MTEKIGAMNPEQELLERKILQALKDNSGKTTKDLIIVQNRLYAQFEALTWLTRAANLSWSLPPLRGWAASPDVLLRLHEHVRHTKPKMVVECGSGSSTLVIADALRQNGLGRLISLDHSPEFGGKTRELLKREGLLEWVDLRIADLKPWDGMHLSDESEEVIKWYAQSAVNNVRNIDLLFVDGPPGATCKFARYPALAALVEHLSPGAQVWMDDTVRQEEVEICKDWAERFGYSTEFFPLEKGLGILKPLSRAEVITDEFPAMMNPDVLVELEQHLTINQPEVILQFGISAVTLPLLRALKAHGKGRLICVTAPSDIPEEFNQRLESESLQANFLLLLSEVTEWPYKYLANCNAQLKQWFPESLLDTLPQLDWLIVDGTSWPDEAHTCYPALPSVLDLLALNAQTWILGANNPPVKTVVDAWRQDFNMRQTAESVDGIARLRKVSSSAS